MTNQTIETGLNTGSSEGVTDTALARVEKVAAMLDCGVSTVWAYAASGKLPKPIKAAGLTRWRISDIEAYLDALHHQANAA